MINGGRGDALTRRHTRLLPPETRKNGGINGISDAGASIDRFLFPLEMLIIICSEQRIGRYLIYVGRHLYSVKRFAKMQRLLTKFFYSSGLGNVQLFIHFHLHLQQKILAA